MAFIGFDRMGSFRCRCRWAEAFFYFKKRVKGPWKFQKFKVRGGFLVSNFGERPSLLDVSVFLLELPT